MMIPFNLDSSSSSLISCECQRFRVALTRVTHLHGHHDIGRSVEDLLNRSVITLAELSHNIHLVHVDIETGPVLKLDTLRGDDCFSELERSRWVPKVSAQVYSS